MTETANGVGGQSALPGFLLETLALFAALAGLFLALEPTLATISGFLATVAYAMWGFARAVRELAESPPTPASATACGLSHFAGGTFVAGGLSMLVMLGWIGWAYERPGDGGHPLESMLPGMTSVLIVVFLAAAATLVVSPAFLRGGDEGYAVFYRRILRRGEWTGLLSAVMASGLGFAIIGVLNVGATLAGLIPIVESQNPHRSVSLWEIATVFPVLPVTLAAVAALLAAHRRMNPAMIARVRGKAAAGAGRERPVLWFTPVAGAAVILGGMVSVIHMGSVAALGLVAEISPAMSVVDGLGDWVAEQRADGRTGAEIVAALEADGYWSGDEPAGGLVTLIPELTEDETAGLLESACRYRVVAGIADTAEVEDVDWLVDEEAASDVKYCLAIACPSPVVWDAPPALILNSSHASRNSYWAETLFMDVFATGVAKPGGYCTAIGDLAENFQG